MQIVHLLVGLHIVHHSILSNVVVVYFVSELVLQLDFYAFLVQYFACFQ